MERLLEIIDTLLAPGGCPWDREQTVESLRGSIHEETHEILDAIHNGDDPNLCEEIGDLLSLLLLLCRVAEKEGRFSLDDVLQETIEKLIRRHPHVFGEAEASSSEEAMVQWQQIKAEERKGRPEHPLDRLPRSFPALSRAKRIQKYSPSSLTPSNSEEELGRRLWEVIEQHPGHDPELALHRWIACCERSIRSTMGSAAGDLEGGAGSNQVRTGT